MALALLIVAWFALPPLEDVIYRPTAHAVGLHMIQHGAMMLVPYGWLMIVRLAVNLALVIAILRILGRKAFSFPLPDVTLARHVFLGSGIGLLVMMLAILCIVISGAAHVSSPPQSAGASALYGLGWLAFDLVGAAGEELYGRGAVLLVAATFFGPRGAIIASGLSFILIHLDNPGANWVWLLRLFLQGVLLAYAVYRTGSL